MPDRADALQQQMYQDLQWCTHNQELQHAYAGQLVVVHQKQVLTAGLDRAHLLRQAASPEHPREELVIVEILPDDFELPPDIV